MKVQFIKTTDHKLIADTLKKEDLGKKIIGFIPDYNKPINPEWIFLICKIEDEVAGIVMLRHIKARSYHIHVGLYKEYYGKGQVLGKFLLKMVLPCEFSGVTLIAPTQNRLSKRLAQVLEFEEVHPNVYKYEVA